MTKDGDTYVLVVNDVFGEDADEYCVKATTAAGSRASRADLVIKSQCHRSVEITAGRRPRLTNLFLRVLSKRLELKLKAN